MRLRTILLCSALLLTASSTAPSAATLADRKPISYEALMKGFPRPDMAYAPFMFWFWDEPIDVDKARDMAKNLASQHINPGYAHGRTSIVRGPGLPDSEWLGAKWFEAFDTALGTAEANHSYLGYCDEYMWPSLRAHGRVLKAHPELEAESLNWTTIDVRGGSDVDVPESFFTVAAQLAAPLPKESEEDLRPNLQLGRWIWCSPVRPNQTCYFRKTVDIAQGPAPESAVVEITADNSYRFFLDGKLIGSGNDWAVVGNYNVTAQLSPGSHTLAVEAVNRDLPAGMLFGMAVKLRDGTVSETSSDGTWLVTAEPQSEGWQKPGFRPDGWAAASEIAPASAGPWKLSPQRLQRERHSPRLIRSRSLRIIGSGGPFVWQAPTDDDWRIYVFGKYAVPKVNYLDSRLPAAFVGTALEPYAKRYGSRMGRSIPGDFIDNEGAYGDRLAWSSTLEQRYKTNYGRDIRLWMPMMIDEDAEGVYACARFDWFDTVSNIYSETFSALTRWHESRGMYTTGHFWEESLVAQLRAVGDHLRQQRALSMPGQDCLGNKALDVHDFKEAQSVAEFKGSRFMTEFMGAGAMASSNAWGTFTPENVKRCTNAVIAWGAGHVIPHGLFMYRQLDNNPWVPDWYTENPMFPYLHLWADFTRRASWVNSHGHQAADVLLLSPMDTIWTLSGSEMLDPAVSSRSSRYPELRPSGKRINLIGRVYSRAMRDLTAKRVEYLIADDDYVRQMRLKGPRLVLGGYSFGAVVLPPMDVLPLEIAQKIAAFADAGGAVYALGELPTGSTDTGMNDPQIGNLMKTLRAQRTFFACPDGIGPMVDAGEPGLGLHLRFLSAGFHMLQHHRRIDGRDFFWLANNGDQERKCSVSLPNVHGGASIWDCETGEVRPIGSTDTPAGARMQLVFKPYEAYWLVIDPKKPAERPHTTPRTRLLASIDGPWTVSIDPASQPDLQHPFSPPAEYANAGVRHLLEPWSKWGLDKFSGLLDYRTTIHVDRVQPGTQLDLGRVCYVAEVWVNGQPVGQRMWGPHVFDITPALRPGTNEIRVRVGNLVNNSYGDMRESGLLGPVRLICATS